MLNNNGTQFKMMKSNIYKIVIVVFVTIILGGCSSGDNQVTNISTTNNKVPQVNYTVDHYLDTIQNHIILTTVVYTEKDISVSTELLHIIGG